MFVGAAPRLHLPLPHSHERRETMEWRNRIFPAGARTPHWAHRRPTLVPLQLKLRHALGTYPYLTYMGDYLETDSGYYSHPPFSSHILTGDTSGYTRQTPWRLHTKTTSCLSPLLHTHTHTQRSPLNSLTHAPSSQATSWP
jgi:hypothetical protein